MSRSPIPHQGEPRGERLEPLLPTVSRPSNVRGSGEANIVPLANSTSTPVDAGRASSRPSSRASIKSHHEADPLANSTSKPTEAGRATRASQNETLNELIRRARAAKRELQAMEREIADVMMETPSSITEGEGDVQQWFDDTDRVGQSVQQQPAVCVPRPINDGWPTLRPLQPDTVQVPTAKAPVAQPTAIGEELKRIDERCEQQLLKERLLAIERCELRRMIEKKRLLESRQSSNTAKQREEQYRSTVRQ
uniref:Uncharacterized protein n=1 Tax=Anopheles maculatus TaxID=74869 RepID=A0A182SEV2_9DIPT